MARIRSIKPEFWEDYKLADDLERDQRLFYIGLWNQADDEGRFLAHPRRLLGAIFPYDRDLDAAFIEGSLRTLADTHRLVLYEVNGEPYGQLTKFGDHQRVNRPTPSRIPAPPKDLGSVTEYSLKAHGGITEGSHHPAHVREVEQGAGSRDEKHSSDTDSKGLNGRQTWLTPYANEWTQRAGGEPTYGALARYLKPVQKKHGMEATLRAWTTYLDKTDPQFYSPSSFASKIGHWLKASKPAFRGYS